MTCSAAYTTPGNEFCTLVAQSRPLSPARQIRGSVRGSLPLPGRSAARPPPRRRVAAVCMQRQRRRLPLLPRTARDVRSGDLAEERAIESRGN